jgi:MFS transporter, DHA2 family, multidrug resistance protein
MVIIGILMGVTTGLPPTEGPFASAMFNTVKTFSAAVATAILQGVGTAREHFHSSMLVDRLGNNPLVDRLGNNPFAGGQNLESGHGLGELAQRIHEQAVVLTSADLYLVMAGIAVALLLVIPFLPVRIYPPWSTTPPPSR